MYKRLPERAFLLLSIIVLSCSGYAQSGCTTSTACNYDPLAVINDGSCCFQTCITVDVTPDTFFGIDNSYWEMADINGNILGSGTDGVTQVCITSSCFIFYAYDDFGDGWGTSGAYTISEGATILVDGGTFLSGYQQSQIVEGPDCTAVWGCTLPFACNYDPLATAYDESCLFAGCTDPLALNYNPNAGCDDGSCTSYAFCGGGLATDDFGYRLDFKGNIQLDNWTQLVEGSGFVDYNPFHLLLGSSNNSPLAGSQLSQVTIEAPSTGTYSFAWDYYTTDAAANYEIGYYINGVRVDVTDVTGGLTQAGTISFGALEGDLIGFGIESTDDIGGPAYFLVSDFKSPSMCGCIAASACNYDSAAQDGSPNLCDWDCYGCGGDVSCNYVPFASMGVGANTIGNVFNDIYFTHPWLTIEEVVAFFNTEIFLVPCVYGVGDPLTCDCYDSLWPTEAWVQALPSQSYVRDAPYTCNSQQTFGMAGGSSAALEFRYLCTDQAAAFDAYPGDFAEIHLYLPSSVPSLQLSGFGSSFASITIHGHAGLTVTGGVGGSVSVTILTDGDVCGCMDITACNFSPIATQDDGLCELPDGCGQLGAINYCPGTTCGINCIFETPCGFTNSALGTATRKLGYNGDYDESQWTAALEGLTGGISFNGDLMVISGDDSSVPGDVWTSATVSVPLSGLLSFNYQYFSVSALTPHTSKIEYLQNGDWLPLDAAPVNLTIEGTQSLFLTSGDTFGLRISNVPDGVINDLTVTHFFHPIAPIVCNSGCTSPLACNFDPGATGDDGSCEYLSCTGCTYPDADNYDPTAIIDDGSCIGPDGICPTDLDGDGFTQTADLLLVLSAFGTACP